MIVSIIVLTFMRADAGPAGPFETAWTAETIPRVFKILPINPIMNRGQFTPAILK